jgi:hypothetical protein
MGKAGCRMKRVGGWIAVAGLLAAIGSLVTCGVVERLAGTVYTADQAAVYRMVHRAGLMVFGVGALVWLIGALRKKSASTETQ